MNLVISCKICDSKSFKPFRVFGGFEYIRCINCGVVIMKKEFSPKELSHYYDADYFKKDYKKSDEFSYFSDHEPSVKSCGPKVALLKEYLDFSNARILDVGCAAGYFLEAVKRDTPSVLVEGVEISPDAAKIARENFNIPIIASDLLEVVGEGKYDAITMFQTLEHLSDPVGYLKKCHLLLKEGGFLFVEVPNMRTIDRFFDKGVLERIFSVPYHVFMFDPPSLKYAVLKSGFTLVKQRIYMSTSIGGFVKSFLRVRSYQEKSLSGSSGSVSQGGQRRSIKKVLFSKIRDIVACVIPGSNMLVVAQKL